jgi:hypothetical protein
MKLMPIEESSVSTCQKLFSDLTKNTLYTYKVQYDGGSAPNPYSGTCTLAICKPAIRRTAKKGDVIVGFACKSNGDNELRIVYCMVVDEAIEWTDYIERCESGQEGSLSGKIPKNDRDPGDCIWKRSTPHDPRASWSRHDASDFCRDVERGERVLLSRTYWYFGSASLVCLEDQMLPALGRGHRSTSNDDRRESFQTFFCDAVNKLPRPKIANIYGRPSISSGLYDDHKCGRCRVAERESDFTEDEDGGGTIGG